MGEEVRNKGGRRPNDGGVHKGGTPGEPAHNRKVDVELMVELAQEGCSNAEIARILEVNPSTLTMHHRAALERARAEFGHTLRQLQIKRAKAGSDTMLIWLGKQYLKQTDKITTVSKISLEGMTDDELEQLDQLLISDGEDETTGEG